MADKKRPLTVDELWQFERIGGASLSPDGAQAVCSVSRYSMEENNSHSSLWLLSTFGGAARALTSCGDKDGQPAWSPRRGRSFADFASRLPALGAMWDAAGIHYHRVPGVDWLAPR